MPGLLLSPIILAGKMLLNLSEFLLIAIPIFTLIDYFRQGYLSFPIIETPGSILPPESYLIGFVAGSAIFSSYLFAINQLSKENKIEEEPLTHSLILGVFFVALIRWASYFGPIGIENISQYVVDGLYISPFIIWAVSYHWLRRDYKKTGVSVWDLYKNLDRENFSKLKDQIEVKKKSNFIRYILISLISNPVKNTSKLVASLIIMTVGGVISFITEATILSNSTGLFLLKIFVLLGLIGYILASLMLVVLSKIDLTELKK